MTVAQTVMFHRNARRSHGLAREASVALAAIVAAALVLGWWYLGDGPSLFSAGAPQSQALRDYIDAAKRRDCPAVVEALSRRTRELAEARVAGRSTVEPSFCDYSPAPAGLSDFETDRIRVEDVSGPVAHVSATYTYERLFGLFGRGRDRHTYTLVLEDGRWRIELAEHLDPASRSNRDGRAMFLVHQTWVAVTDHRRATGELTSDPDVIRGELPGFEFPEIRAGVAGGSSPVDTPFVTTGASVACISLRSATGTLVMLKIPQGTSTGTYEYGRAIPTGCDPQPLARPYHGTSSGIK
jgi:hypothetical protein